ncbi:MAG: alpha/beta fold hydrolase, partial [Eubacteriales bacterium]
MKHFAKKSLSLLLVLAMVFGTVSAGAVTSLAAPAKTVSVAVQSENTQVEKGLGDSANPCIVVPGIGMSAVALYDANGKRALDAEGKEIKTWNVLNLDTAPILADIWKLVPKALLSIVLQKDIGLSNIVRDYMPEMFKLAAHDNQGNPVMNVKAIEHNYPLSQFNADEKSRFFNMMPMQKYVDTIGENKIYSFNFPPFTNIYTQAGRLDAFIQMVKQQTGYDKVNLVAVSLGATVTNAYFSEYANKHDIGKVVNIVASNNGSLVFADLVGQNYSVDSAKKFYSDIAPQLMDGYMGYLINILIRILPKQVLNNVLDAAFAAIQKDFFTNIPSMWATVPSE